MATVFIGLPVYNGEDFLDGAIDCLLAQTYGDFVVLVSDNASTDATESIARKWAARDPRVRYHRHERNMGAAPNFNYCVERAEGRYFKWMAHDDKLAPEYLERCVSLLEEDDGAVLCHAGVVSIDDSGTVVGEYDRERDFNHSDPVVRFRRAMALDHACVSVFGVIRLDALRRTQKIAPFVGSDRSLLADLALHGRLEYVDEPLFFWRDHKSRSVRMRRKDRVAWFDANAKAILATLYLRQVLAAQGAAIRARHPLGMRARAFWETVKWTVKNRIQLWRDVRAVGGILLGMR